jgi:hypothetical protein
MTVLNGLLITSIAVTVEKWVLSVATVSFYKKAYADRLVIGQFTDYVLDRLYGAAKKKRRLNGTASPPYQPWWQYLHTPGSQKVKSPPPQSQVASSPLRFEGEDLNETTTGSEEALAQAEIDHSLEEHGLKAKSKSFLNRSFNFVNAVSEVSGVNTILKGTKAVLTDVTTAAIDTIVQGASSDTDLVSVVHAKKLAVEIYRGLLPDETSTCLVVADFMPHFNHEDEAKRAFNIFDRDGSGDISKF